MCDERTMADDAAWLSRRDVAGAGLAAMAILPGCSIMGEGTMAAGGSGAASAVSRAVGIPTADGTLDAFFAHPASGRHPAVLFWPDIAGPRPANQQMAMRLASAGYAVLLLNQYYRSAPAPHFQTNVEWRTPEGRARVQAMLPALSPAGMMRDATAALAWLDQQAVVDTRRGAAAIGYCMGGPFAFRSAAAVPERFRAVASFHGSNLVTDDANSPHLLLSGMRAALLVAIAQNDDAEAPTHKYVLWAAAQAAGRPAEIEVYAAQHGWCTLDSPVHDPAEADRAWARMLALFAAQL